MTYTKANELVWQWISETGNVSLNTDDMDKLIFKLIPFVDVQSEQLKALMKQMALKDETISALDQALASLKELRKVDQEFHEVTHAVMQAEIDALAESLNLSIIEMESLRKAAAR